MAALDQRPCKLGELPRACCIAHLRPKLEPYRNSNTRFHCPLIHAHDEFAINPGKHGQRIVFGCFADGVARPECTSGKLRRALIDLGIDEGCLGGLGKYHPDFTATLPVYGSPRRGRQQLVDPSIIAKASKWDAIYELPSAIDGKLLEMCRQALHECEPDQISSDPWDLLPASRKEFFALAERAGLGNYRYQLHKKWLAISDTAA